MSEVKRTRKICVSEVVAQEGTEELVPTGRRMYIDSDAPLHLLSGWTMALETGHCAVAKTMFDSIVKIVDEDLKKLEKVDRRAEVSNVA